MSIVHLVRLALYGKQAIGAGTYVLRSIVSEFVHSLLIEILQAC